MTATCQTNTIDKAIADAREAVRASHRRWVETDRAWHEELVVAFGSDATIRRYDQDKSEHPDKCRAAHELVVTGKADYEAALGKLDRLLNLGIGELVA